MQNCSVRTICMQISIPIYPFCFLNELNAMKIIEKHLQSKNCDASLCEDAIYFNNNFACVIDGATSMSDLLWDGLSPGKFASELISETIATFYQHIKSETAISKINDRIAEEYNRRNILDRVLINPSDRLIASLIIYSKFYSEIWIVGDCHCLFDDKLISNTNQFSKLLSEIRSLFLHAELFSGKRIRDLQERDTGREYILPLLEKQGIFQNKLGTPWSFGVIDGFELRREFIKPVKIPLDTDFLVLASDGYPVLKPTLDESERVLKEILEEDPLCIKIHKSTKGKNILGSSFDDRAYIRIAL